MATGYRNSAGSDFDSIFALNQSGQYAANVGMRTSDGTDLSRRYEILSFGSKVADVNYRNAAGVDVTQLWAKAGTAVYSLGFNGKPYASTRQALTNESTNITASLTVSILANGTWSIGAMSGSPVSGTWLPAGRSVSEYSVQIAVSGNSRVVVTNGASAYVAASSGPGATLSATVRGNSVDDIDETMVVTVRLRHSSGTVTSSSFSAHVRATGFL